MNQQDVPDTEIEQTPGEVLSDDIRTILEQQDSYVQHVMRRLGIAYKSNVYKKGDEGLLKHCRTQMNDLYEYVSLLKRGLNRWCLSVLIWEFFIFLIIGGAVLGVSFMAGYWSLESPFQPWLQLALERPALLVLSLLVFIIVWIFIHSGLRQQQARSVVTYLAHHIGDDRLSKAFLKNTTFWHSIFRPEPVGWSWLCRRRAEKFKQAIEDAAEKKMSPVDIL